MEEEGFSRMSTLFRVSLFVASFLSSAVASENVIFITLDGVRYQEFFGGVQKPARATRPRGTELFPSLKAQVKEGSAWLYGDGIRNGVFKVGNRAGMSLPGYRALLSGEFEDRCRTNRCPNIDRETIFDSLSQRGFSPEDLAVFASWSGMGRALESTPGKIVRDVDRDDYPRDGASPEELKIAEGVKQLDRANRPWWGARRDVYTYALGKLYLERHRPRFLYLSFLDADEHAHANRYRDYTDSLLRYDAWIKELRRVLDTMGDYGANTSIVITTDHGRGKGALWFMHGRRIRSAFRTWAAVIPSRRILEGARAHPRVSENFSQVDIRPTLEKLLGLEPTNDSLHTGIALVEN
jgi:hypothetical protein